MVSGGLVVVWGGLGISWQVNVIKMLLIFFHKKHFFSRLIFLL